MIMPIMMSVVANYMIDKFHLCWLILLELFFRYKIVNCYQSCLTGLIMFLKSAKWMNDHRHACCCCAPFHLPMWELKSTCRPVGTNTVHILLLHNCYQQFSSRNILWVPLEHLEGSAQHLSHLHFWRFGYQIFQENVSFPVTTKPCLHLQPQCSYRPVKHSLFSERRKLLVQHRLKWDMRLCCTDHLGEN